MNIVDIVFFIFLFAAVIAVIAIKHRPLSKEETKEVKKAYERITVFRFRRLVITCVVIIVIGIYYMIVSF
jgi:hypothetical protein